MGRIRLAVAAPIAATTSQAQVKPETMERVEVIGAYANGVGTSDTASQGSVTAKLIETRPVIRPAEIFEFVTGLVVTEHSWRRQGEPVLPARLQLRSWHRLRHLRRAHAGEPAHPRPWQGYTDRNFLIPEPVDRVDYYKGPYLRSHRLLFRLALDSRSRRVQHPRSQGERHRLPYTPRGCGGSPLRASRTSISFPSSRALSASRSAGASERAVHA